MNRSDQFNSGEVEQTRQELWERDAVNRVVEDPSKEKYFMVDMFPYPSGTGIHVGHVKNYVATDVQARMRIRQGQNVLHPMGYDSFGLPAENYALSQGIHPKVAVERNIERFGQQLRRLGLGYDWERQINTSDDEFVRWTQDGFLTLYEKGLVSEEYEPINWCGSCKTGLSNEDLDDNSCCERCGSEVVRKLMRQWSVHITDYADELLDGMKDLKEWEPFLLDIQRNWIGKKEGWKLDTEISSNGVTTQVGVFMNDPAVIANAHYLALSPETAQRINIIDLIEDPAQRAAIEVYIQQNLYKRDKERNMSAGLLVEGLSIENPYNGLSMPVLVSEAVLATSDNGAFFGTPATSERDQKLARALGLNPDALDLPVLNKLDEASLDNLHQQGVLSPEKIYRLEDWVFSRQRFWGEPIPIIHCDDCGAVPVPRDQLPVLLPDVEQYELTDTGESPLAEMDDWVNTTCPDCDGDAKRETNTMPQWAGSSWYWHRFKDPTNQEEMVSKEADSYWGQVDMYVGGAEHAARHLIYARFWNFVMNQAGVVINKEPFKKVQHVGLVMDENGVKISKRLGNGVNLDDVVNTYGADALRLGVMQMGEFSQQTNWNNREITSARRFLDQVWRMQDKVDWEGDTQPSAEVARSANATLEKVTNDIKEFKFNTAIAAIRTLRTLVDRQEGPIPRASYEMILSLLQPFVPHITEQILTDNGFEDYLMRTPWPRQFENVENATQETRTVVVMRNGKKIGVFAISTALTDLDEVLGTIREDSSKVDQLFETNQVKNIIAPLGKNFINLVG